jgi:hypothetical protein
MTILNILYWVLLVLAIIAIFVPSEVYPWARLPSAIWVILFILIGLKVFRTPLT